MTYTQYITSPEWALKRIEALNYHGRFCSKCGTEHRLEVHHLTYKRMGYELMTDLQILCKEHHAEVHNVIDQQAKANEREVLKHAWIILSQPSSIRNQWRTRHPLKRKKQKQINPHMISVTNALDMKLHRQ